MSSNNITMARIYTLEGRDLLNEAIQILKNEENIMGLTIFRGIEGIGASGEAHTSSLVDLSLELPVVIEFFDSPQKVERAIAHLQARLGFNHVVTWPATAHAINSKT